MPMIVETECLLPDARVPSQEELSTGLGDLAEFDCTVIFTGDFRSTIERVDDTFEQEAAKNVVFDDFAAMAVAKPRTVVMNLPWFSGRSFDALLRIVAHEVLHLVAWESGQDVSRLLDSEEDWETLVDLIDPSLEAYNLDFEDESDLIDSLLETSYRVFDEYRVERALMNRGFGPTVRNLDEEWTDHGDGLLNGERHALVALPQRVAHALAGEHPAPEASVLADLYRRLATVVTELPDAEAVCSKAEGAQAVANTFEALAAWQRTHVAIAAA